MRKILNSYILASFLLVSLATFLWTCNDGGGGGGSSTDNTAPTVLGTSPDNNAVDVSIGTTIDVAFSEEMDSSTVNVTNFTVADGGGPVAGTVIYTEAFGSNAYFTPTDPLEPSTIYTATVSTGVTNKAGNALAQDYTWSFTTGAAPTGFTPEMLTGKAFTQINEQGDNHDDWVIQFDTETFNYWEAQFTSGPDTVVPTVGQGNWSISNGDLIVDFPSNATVTLLDNTATYFDVQIDDGINPPENVRLYKTNPFDEADVIDRTFDYGTFTEVFNADHTGTQFDKSQPPQVNSNFTWSIENGALKQTYEIDNLTDIGYRLFNPDPNIVFVFFDENEAFLDVFHYFYTDLCSDSGAGCWDY